MYNENDKINLNEGRNNVKKKSFMGILIVGMIIIVLVLLCVGLILIPKIKKELQNFNKYNVAINFMRNEEYENAIEELKDLDEYKNSKEMIKCVYYDFANSLYEKGDLESAIEKYELAGGYLDAKEKYTETIYEYGKELVLEWNYVDASEYFSKIDYLDSQELAGLYEVFDEQRCIDGKFYYYEEEFAYLLNDLLQQENEDYTAELVKDNITDTPLIYIYDCDEFAGIYVTLGDYDKEKGVSEDIFINWKNVSESENNIGAATYVYCIMLADRMLTASEANDFYLEIIDGASEQYSLLGITAIEAVENGIYYNFSYFGGEEDASMLLIEPEE